MSIDRRYTALIKICVDDKRTLLSIRDSLYAEAVNPANIGKVRLNVVNEGENCIKISIEADTLSHLRALINSVFYIIYSIRNAISIIKAYIP